MRKAISNYYLKKTWMSRYNWFDLGKCLDYSKFEHKKGRKENDYQLDHQNYFWSNFRDACRKDHEEQSAFVDQHHSGYCRRCHCRRGFGIVHCAQRNLWMGYGHHFRRDRRMRIDLRCKIDQEKVSIHKLRKSRLPGAFRLWQAAFIIFILVSRGKIW